MRSGKTAIDANVATIRSMFILKNTIKRIINVDIKRVQLLELFFIELNLEFKSICIAFEMT
jgi:hypothetical protein